MLQYPVRDTVWARSLADPETPDDCVKFLRGGELWFAGRAYKVSPQRHVNHLNNSRDRRIGHRLNVPSDLFCIQLSVNLL